MTSKATKQPRKQASNQPSPSIREQVESRTKIDGDSRDRESDNAFSMLVERLGVIAQITTLIIKGRGQRGVVNSNPPSMRAREFTFCAQPVHNKVISGFQALRQACGGARARNRRVPADLRAGSVSIEPLLT
ncbi:hypothetical protein PoB_002215700 [Plakobranchus ocellatus]|uniref:Uncharacterized protein n=1 Tax=Plakobranchus ocellatus TaxID=259542 RepID=A0AAV3ZLW8_9GAST|nr:hypothetical protein PoB_002215700 [Plakobranchus ocellatus]